MNQLREAIEKYIPCNEQEVRDRAVLLYAIDRLETPLSRENPVAHFSASSWIVNPARDRVLMVWHNIFRSWSWTGGHADGEADLLAVALREAREETGLTELSPVSEDIYSVEVLPVISHIKRGKFVPAHVHLNVSYLLEADDAQQIHCKPDENSGVKWMPLRETEEIREEPFMAEIYKKLNGKLSFQ